MTTDATANTIHVEVTGWDADDCSASWDAWGSTEEEAIRNACKHGGIVEIGEVTII